MAVNHKVASQSLFPATPLPPNLPHPLFFPKLPPPPFSFLPLPSPFPPPSLPLPSPLPHAPLPPGFPFPPAPSLLRITEEVGPKTFAVRLVSTKGWKDSVCNGVWHVVTVVQPPLLLTSLSPRFPSFRLITEEVGPKTFAIRLVST
ncbi:unnamed protein product [Closterium sp. Naga37s-1]|nr:unnamed protein product [Closterium sp. Naga37s-1]